MSAEILVTGATGHVGNVLIRKLNQSGQTVRALIYPGEDTTSLVGLEIERIEGDILKPGDLRDALKGIKYVYHLASLISIGGISDELVRRVNIQGTRNVALACREFGVERLVYASSIHALERPEEGKIIDERLEFDPDNPAGEYDRSKAEASLEILRLAKTGLDAVIVCPTGIIGPFDFRRSEMGRMIADWMKKKPHWMVDGHFDFVDVRDVVDGLISACRKGQTGETYILSGTRIPLADIRRRVQRFSGVQSREMMVPVKLALFGTRLIFPLQKLFRTVSGFTPYSIETVLSNSHISSAKAEGAIGFTKRSIDETLEETAAWWRDNGMLDEHPQWYGKVALITGASGGIGAATAKKLAAMGLQVVLVARRKEMLESLARDIESNGGRAEVIALDLRSDDAIGQIRRVISSRYHGIDVLVNCAGIGWYGYFADMLGQTADAMIEVNNKSLVRLSLLALGMMKDRCRGSIVNIGSIAGEIEAQGVALYAATKSFVNTFTRALSRELRGSRINVSVVKPGAVATEFFAAATRLPEGRTVPASQLGISPNLVADRVWRLLRHPRVYAYVPGGLGILRLVRSLFGLVLDAAGPFYLKRQTRATRS
jgi:dihydroflavonol-4-reductase